jgi:hypothetical protein
MKKTKSDPLAERPNLDWSKAVRGRYAERMKNGSNIVLLEPDVLERFPTSEKVNQALRTLLEIERKTKSVITKASKSKHAAA